MESIERDPSKYKHGTRIRIAGREGMLYGYLPSHEMWLYEEIGIYVYDGDIRAGDVTIVEPE